MGEGALVDVTVHHITDVSGRSGVAMYLDISSAPAPERKYAADTSSVWVKGSTIKLLFGQQRMGGEGLLSLMRDPVDLMTRYGRPFVANTVIMCGTIGAKGGIRPAARFDMELEDPVLKRRMAHGYDVVTLPVVS